MQEEAEDLPLQLPAFKPYTEEERKEWIAREMEKLVLGKGVETLSYA